MHISDMNFIPLNYSKVKLNLLFYKQIKKNENHEYAVKTKNIVRRPDGK